MAFLRKHGQESSVHKPVSAWDSPLLFLPDILWHLLHQDALALFLQPDSSGCISATPCNRMETALDQDTSILPYFLFSQTPDNDVLHSGTRLQNRPHPYDTILVQLQAQYPHPLHTLPLLLHVNVVENALFSSTLPLFHQFCSHIPITLASNSSNKLSG